MNKSRSLAIGFAVMCLVSVSLACGSSATVSPTHAPSLPTTEEYQPSTTPNPTNTPKPTNTTKPTNTPLPPTATPNPNLVEPGTYLIGTDIKPGIYKGVAGQDLFNSCYWERMKDLTESLDSILANDNSIGQFYIEVRDSDFALKTNCQLIRLETIPEHSGEYPQALAPGTYLVGSDIRPGIYKGQAGSAISDSCYWERLRDVAGGFNSILANDNATGQFYVQVVPTDFALVTACELEWSGE